MDIQGSSISTRAGLAVCRQSCPIGWNNEICVQKSNSFLTKSDINRDITRLFKVDPKQKFPKEYW